ncbi:MAG: hypothetical protein HYU56_00280 [Candidatus Aenigmarchaeota archaeon]|nr:hypothetical protein [Candidatus Aenigmarchaeota archaeon]
MDYQQLTEEAQARMVVARAAFDGVKDHYRGLRRFKKNIGQEDLDVLNSCSVLLLPLSVADGDTSIRYAAADMIMEIGIYQARFRNTGVKAYRVPAGWE